MGTPEMYLYRDKKKAVKLVEVVRVGSGLFTLNINGNPLMGGEPVGDAIIDMRLNFLRKSGELRELVDSDLELLAK